MRARVPAAVPPRFSAVVAGFAATTVLVGTGFAAYAVIRHHPSGSAISAAGPTVIAANKSAPVQTTTTVGVAPLRHIVEPDLLVTEPRPMSASTIKRLRKAAHARNDVSFDLGTVRVNGRAATAIAADLSSFRAFTPPPTASADLLWQNLARGDIATSYTFARANHLVVGQQVLLGAQNVRLGAIADFGLPSISVVMSPQNGAAMGLRRSAGILLSAPGRSGSSLTAGARDVMGSHAQVVAMNSSTTTYSGRPRTYIELYKAAARTCPGLSWTVLAAIGQVESDHGRNVGPSSAGALGPMQFMPATWASWGVDADGDHKANIMDPYDAVYAAARYLCYYNPGAGLPQLKRAVFAYNHADWYVNEVLAVAKLYK